MKALDRKVLRDLARLKGQAITIALVIAAGVAGFVTLRSTWSSLDRSMKTYYEHARFGDVFVRLESAPESVRSQLEELGGVASVYTRVVEDIRVPLPEVAQPPIGLLISMPDDRPPPLNALVLARGRLPDPVREDEVLLLEKFAKVRGIDPGETVDVIVRGTLRTLHVVGTALSPEFIYPLPIGGEAVPDEERFAVFWMPRRTLAPILGLEGAFNDVVLRLQPGASERAVLDAVDRALEPYGGLGALERARQPSHDVLEGELAQLEGLATIVPLIFLGVAAFLLNVVLSRLLLLQRPDIATLKAVGYSGWRIALHYLELVSGIVILGTLLGLALGAYLGDAMNALYARVFGFPDPDYRLTAQVALSAVAISFAAGFGGAVLALRQVVRLPPAEAMRPAPPANYRRTLLERAGFAALLGQTGRMILRELERRPVRSALSLLAIAMATAVLVVGRFYLDSIDFIVDLQFHRASREDLSVEFQEPLPDRAIRELSKLPGVLHAEGLRSVPVRFRAGHRSRDGVLRGYPPDLRLRSIVSLNRRHVPIPGDGVLLTRTLAELLGVGVGDTVEIEVREGRRGRHRLRVGGLVDEMIGLQGHLPLDRLLRVLGEQEGVSTALLTIDPAFEADIRARLSDLPTVASVTSRLANTRHFLEQMGETVVVMTLVVTLFAATIAIGVVYNNARIALASRSRDLASLRVIGYTRREISIVLLGELAVEVLAALPIGLLLGRGLAQVVVSTVQSERIRLPAVVSAETYAFAAAVTLGAGLVSALIVRRRLDRLDLIGVLKTRE